MASTWDIGLLWQVVGDVKNLWQDKKERRKEGISKAHEAVNAAFIKTYDYLRNKNGNYQPNIELAEAWNKASSSVMKVNKALGETLYFKSRFWLDPDLYINLNKEGEIIELNRVVDEMGRLRLLLND